MIWVGLGALYIGGLLLLSGLLFGRALAACWREPVFKFPVFIFESDDWGAGPLEQAAALRGLQQLLSGYRDQAGRAPVFTLGVILAVAEGKAIGASHPMAYRAIDLTAPVFSEIKQAMAEGARASVFSLHLHGKEHYWPPALMAAAKTDSGVRQWVCSERIEQTEMLPAHLQSRWVDASVLPSRPLAREAIRAAVAEESALFAACFGVAPKVAVATTFIWNDDVEAAWFEQGIEVVVSPGARNTCRDAAGQPSGEDKKIVNGDQSIAGQQYLVRDVYFEPDFGHAPMRLISAMQERTHQGRPCLVETHRFNFLGGEARLAACLHRIAQAIEGVQQALPAVRFLSASDLALAMRDQSPTLIEQRFLFRFRVWLRRVKAIPRFRKFARLSGLAFILLAVEKAVGA